MITTTMSWMTTISKPRMKVISSRSSRRWKPANDVDLFIKAPDNNDDDNDKNYARDADAKTDADADSNSDADVKNRKGSHHEYVGGEYCRIKVLDSFCGVHQYGDTLFFIHDSIAG